MSEYNGLTEGKEIIKGFVGGRPVLLKTLDDRDKAIFDVFWGINDSKNNKFGTWRHCLAYGEQALNAGKLTSGNYVLITGWITTNPVYENGRIVIVNDKPLTREYLIVQSIIILERDKKRTAKQLSLVA